VLGVVAILYFGVSLLKFIRYTEILNICLKAFYSSRLPSKLKVEVYVFLNNHFSFEKVVQWSMVLGSSSSLAKIFPWVCA
jgi:hypothetical protein